MLATLIAWLYITFLCWTWGTLTLTLLKSSTKNELPLPHFTIICIIGLSVITIIAGLLSLFLPLGEWWVQFIFIIPGLSIFFLKNVHSFFFSLKKEFVTLHITSLILLSSLLLIIIVMSTWKIIHPDTLGYHAQTMQWIEKYRAVPGLVHLHVRFGYQGLWYVNCALFDFSFTGKQGITFLNSAFLFWFLLFTIHRIDHNFFKEGTKKYGLLWLVLLVMSFWSYTQIRLTATSASPDFIATIFVLAIIYLLLEKEVKHLHAGDWLTVSLLAIVVATIKLSVAPVLIIPFIALLLFLVKRKFKHAFVLLIIGILSFSSFISRNIITSGYVIFPSTTIDISDADWKYSRELTAKEKNYITAYAKIPGTGHNEEIEVVNNSSIRQWVPEWWASRSVADKSILTLFLLSIIAGVIFSKRILYSGFIPLLVIITILIGILFWFINAPDPRFGFGFILGSICTITFLIIREKNISVSKKILPGILIICSVAAIAYATYRSINFFTPDQIITPLGIPASEFKAFDCGAIRINSPINADFGITPIPCTDLNCDNFIPRGSDIRGGFRSK